MSYVHIFGRKQPEGSSCYVRAHGIKSAELTCHRFAMHNTSVPWLENQMSAAQPLDFLRTWYNNMIRVFEIFASVFPIFIVDIFSL